MLIYLTIKKSILQYLSKILSNKFKRNTIYVPTKSFKAEILRFLTQVCLT